ncbi:MAG: hypothetical protein WC726_01010 [Parcubacteria group bacterium]|jgi:hypothetical protein
MKNKHKIKTIFITSVILLIFFSSFHPIFAQYTNQEKIPGAQPTDQFIPYLQSIINFGFAIIGILALFMLIIGAYQYLMAAGSGKAEDAKDTITSALLGLALGLTAWIILNKINPDLVNMRGITQITGGSRTTAGTSTPGTTPGGGTLSPSDMSKVKCDTVKNYNGFMNKNLSDGLYNENIKSAEDLRNSLISFRKDNNGLVKYADTIYQACQDAKVPYWYAIGTFAKETSMFSDNGRCVRAKNPGCVMPDGVNPLQYDTPEQGIADNIRRMGARLKENPTPLGAWNAWYWPDRPGNCAGAQEYLGFFSKAAGATGLAGI